MRVKHGFLASFEDLAGIWNGGFTPRAWVKDLLDELPGQVEVVILSDTNAIHWEYTAANILDRATFDHIFVSHESGMMKDSRDVFDIVIEQIGKAPDQMIFIDDTLSNTTHASTSGLNTHHFRDKAGMLVAIEEHLGR